MGQETAKRRVDMIRILLIIIAISLLIGCSSSSPVPKYYTLNTIPTDKNTEIYSVKDSDIVFGIGPVEIPDYLDKPQIVTRTAENELMLSEFNLWGGSLKIDVMRVLIENISSLLAPKKITIISWKTSVPEAYRIPIYLLRLDASANGSIFLKAKWGIVAKDGRTVVSIREFSITKPIKGNDYKDIVYAMSDVLADFSKEIVSIIQSILKLEG